MPEVKQSESYGSAVLYAGGRADLSNFFDRARTGTTGIPLGLNEPTHKFGLMWGLKNQQGMGLTIGSTRCGKGVSSIIPALLTYSGGSCVVIDPKGENAWITAERRREMGHRVVILDPWDEVNRRWGNKFGVVEKTTKFNPLSALDPNDPDFADDCTAVADALVIDQSSDPHWSNSARELITGLVAAIVERAPGRGSLRHVRKLLTASTETLQNSIDGIVADAPESLGARKLAGFVDGGREVDSIRSTARTQTAILDSDRLSAAMETDEQPFNLQDIGKDRVTVYLVLPVDKLDTHGRWLRLIITLLIRSIAKQATPPANPVLFLLDEFGTIGKLQAVETAYGLLAGLNIRLWAFLQGLDQLQHFYPHSWQTFIGNSSIIQILNARSDASAEWVSKYLGTATATINKGGFRQHSYIPDKSDPRWEGPNMTVKTMVPDTTDIGRPLMFPDEVRMLKPDESIVMIPGFANTRINRFVYHQEPRWAGWYRDPYKYVKPAQSLSQGAS